EKKALFQKCLIVTKFCGYSYNLINCEYCIMSFHCTDCFGCIGLKNKQYCIFNKQYTKENYFIEKEKIIKKMSIPHLDKEGLGVVEYGEFFPAKLPPYGYNESIANEYYPLYETEIKNSGFKYKQEEDKVIYSGEKNKLENDIKNVSSDILKKILTCKTCDKNYRLVEPELLFYKEKNIPLPEKCSSCRHLERTELRNPRKLFDRKCDKCEIDIKTTYNTDREEIVICEECYQKEISIIQ
ncbi:MAG: hypothetical protein Q9M94_07820, partial [Candidatus Gracilibacteria bacterium]|nr:hypothetical protein [Candidatus Gracilibacteria bacterium]